MLPASKRSSRWEGSAQQPDDNFCPQSPVVKGMVIFRARSLAIEKSLDWLPFQKHAEYSRELYWRLHKQFG
jgi:hypothetical protein